MTVKWTNNHSSWCMRKRVPKKAPETARPCWGWIVLWTASTEATTCNRDPKERFISPCLVKPIPFWSQPSSECDWLPLKNPCHFGCVGLSVGLSVCEVCAPQRRRVCCLLPQLLKHTHIHTNSHTTWRGNQSQSFETSWDWLPPWSHWQVSTVRNWPSCLQATPNGVVEDVKQADSKILLVNSPIGQGLSNSQCFVHFGWHG